MYNFNGEPVFLRYGADATRLALANSGDSIEDANFETTVADAAVLRLWTFVELIKELLAEVDSMRTSPALTVNDHMFAAEMNLKINESRENYNGMLFKEALRTCYFEYSNLFHQYRERSAVQGGPHSDLVKRYITTQVLILSPICPHICDHIWRDLLMNNSSILRAAWPSVSEPDLGLVKASAYLADISHSFRLRLKSAMAVKTKKNSSAHPEVKPTNGVIWVAKTFPDWQSSILAKMHEMYEANGKQLPDNKEISKALGSMPELKKYMKKVMPFAQTVREQLTVSGPSAFRNTVEFDEENIIKESMGYLKDTLLLETLEMKWTHECDNEKTKMEVIPGEPFLSLSTAPHILISVVNPQPFTSVFSFLLPVFEADTGGSIVSRLVRQEKGIKPPTKVTLHRYVDPTLGPRVLPNMNEPLAGTEPIEDTDEFLLSDGGSKVTVAGKPLGEKVLVLLSTY